MPTGQRYVFPPTQDAPDAGRVVLRDGSTADVRLATSADCEAMAEFYTRLPEDDRRRRFLSASLPSADVIAGMCEECDPGEQRTLVVTRLHDGKSRIIATGSYFRKKKDVAEVALAVDESFKGKGLGTILVERLAVLAALAGFRRFWAVTSFDNAAMRDVFRESGFAPHETAVGGTTEIDFSVKPDENTLTRFEARDRVATVASLRPFFRPHGVAVIGASRDPGSIGYQTLNAVVGNGFKGPIFPVNPKADELLGLKVYPSILDVPQQVDLAIITVPAKLVFNVVDECAKAGVRALVVITAGFAEVRGDGTSMQKDLLARVRGHGMRMIGPNCMGILNTDPAVSLNASFSPVFPPAGGVAMSSQSGALGLAVLAAARRLDLGISTFVSVGNKADVSGNDLLQWWESDPTSRVILLYLESFGNPRRFARVARRVSANKPIVAIKSGRGASGTRAAGSHTAALAAPDVAVDALFQQTGVIRAQTLEEMFDLTAALANQPLPPGNRVGIITNAGGPGILCADACEAGGLVIPELSAETRAKLSFLPAAASVGNPVDMVASATPEQYRRTIEVLLAAGEIDSLIVIYIPVGLGQPLEYGDAIRQGVAMGRKQGGESKTVLGCWMGNPIDGGPQGIPVYAFPEAPARVLASISRYAKWRAKPVGRWPEFDDIDPAAARKVCQDSIRDHGPGWLSAEDAFNVLRSMKLPVAACGVAKSAEEAVKLFAQAGGPVAIKLVSRTLTHKTEVGGVRLNLKDADTVRAAFDDIRQSLEKAGQLAAFDGVLVQPMVTGGVEVMIGMTLDPSFGPLVALGLGGVFAEVLKDVNFRIAPLTDRDADEMLEALRGRRLLEGYRGQPPADRGAIKETLLRLSRLVEEVPEIRELDLNPVIALPEGRGCVIVDARVRVG